MGCHVWKQCLKCAESLYGEECTAQNIKYNVKLVTGQYECQNAPGTCRKAICECDLAFAQFTGKSEFSLVQFLRSCLITLLLKRLLLRQVNYKDTFTTVEKRDSISKKRHISQIS